MGAMTIRNDERIYFFELQRCRRTLKCAQPAIIYRSPPVSMIALPSSLSAARSSGSDRALPARVERPVLLSAGFSQISMASY
jgi:hypothetical protein